MAIELRSEYCSESQGLDFGAFLDEQFIFGGTKYQSHTMAFWDVSPQRAITEYVGAMGEFARKLDDGYFSDHPNGTYHSGVTEQPFSAEIKIGDKKVDLGALVRQHSKSETLFVNLWTPKARLVFEKWSPDAYRLCVVSHNNLADPVADFFMETGQYKVDRRELTGVLQEAYTFIIETPKSEPQQQ